MAELVDALRSGRSVLMDVEVRVLFWAPKHPRHRPSLCLSQRESVWSTGLEMTNDHPDADQNEPGAGDQFERQYAQPPIRRKAQHDCQSGRGDEGAACGQENEETISVSIGSEENGRQLRLVAKLSQENG